MKARKYEFYTDDELYTELFDLYMKLCRMQTTETEKWKKLPVEVLERFVDQTVELTHRGLLAVKSGISDIVLRINDYVEDQKAGLNSP